MKNVPQQGIGTPTSGNATPDFAECWAAAEQIVARERRRRRYRIVTMSVACVGALTLLLSTREPPAEDAFLIADSLMNEITWTAPSDTLMPTHTFDIYDGIAMPDMSTDHQEGSLL